MSKDFIKLKDELISDIEIKNLIEKYNLTDGQILEAVPIFFRIIEERSFPESNYKTSLKLENGRVLMTTVLSKKGLSEEYKNNIVTNSFNNFEVSNEELFEETKKNIFPHIYKYIKGSSEKKGLYLYGEMGIGKTFISKRLAKKLAENGKKVGFIDVPSLILKVKQTFGNEKEHNRLLASLINADYLFLDDIGSEQISEWFRDEFLFSLLNSRMENKKITFFTSNYSQDDLIRVESRTKDKKYPQKDKALRLVERVKALSNPLFLKGKNRRY